METTNQIFDMYKISCNFCGALHKRCSPLCFLGCQQVHSFGHWKWRLCLLVTGPNWYEYRLQWCGSLNLHTLATSMARGQITIPYIIYINGTVILSCIVFAYTYQKCCFWSSLVGILVVSPKWRWTSWSLFGMKYVLWARIKNPLKIDGWKMHIIRPSFWVSAYFLEGQAVSFRVPGWHSPYLQVVLSLHMLFEQNPPPSRDVIPI